MAPITAATARMANSSRLAKVSGEPAGRDTCDASPSSDRPDGRPTATMTTRMLCTMAMARRSEPTSAATARTCDMPPGAEAR